MAVQLREEIVKYLYVNTAKDLNYRLVVDGESLFKDSLTINFNAPLLKLIDTATTPNSGQLSIDANGYTNLQASNHLYLRSGASKEIVFYTNTSARAKFNSSGHFLPGAVDTYDIGTSSTRWRAIYASNIYAKNTTSDSYRTIEAENSIGGVALQASNNRGLRDLTSQTWIIYTRATSNSTDTGIANLVHFEKGAISYDNITPSTNNTYTLGSSSYKWKNIYATQFNGDHNGTISGVVESDPSSNTYYTVLFIDTQDKAAVNTTKYTRLANKDFNFYVMNGTAETEGHATIVLGNTTATGTTGNKRGRLRLYGTNTGYATLQYTNSTASPSVTIPEYGGYLTVSASSQQNYTSEKAAYVPFYTQSYKQLGMNNGFRYYTLEGTADALGYGKLYLGNGTSSGTAGNKYGLLKLYNINGISVDVRGNDIGKYGGLRTSGLKGSYHGILLGNATSALTIMSKDGSDQGLYNEAISKWLFYHNGAGSICLLGSSVVADYPIVLNAATNVKGNVLVNGAVRFAIGNSDAVADKRFIVGTSGNRYLSIGGAGIQAYLADNSVGTLYLQNNGGKLDVGSASATGTFRGAYDFVTANGFTYSGIGSASDNAARPIWFSYNGITGRPVYHDSFKFNPSTISLSLTRGSYTTSLSVNSDNATYLTAGYTLYISSGTGTSVVFRKGTSAHARFDTSGHLIPEATVTYNIGSASKLWKQMNTHHLQLLGATNATMTASSTNPRITFAELNSDNTLSQPVHLIYTDYNNYRSPAGLKVIGGTEATPAWFEVEGDSYINGAAYIGNGYVEILKDGEGGTIKLHSKSNTYIYEIDAYNDETIRIHTASKNPNGVNKFISWNGKNGNLSLDGLVYIKNTYPAMAMTSDGSYWGMGTPDAGFSNWIRTTVNGIIPYSSDQTNGKSSLGTSSWPFSAVYAKAFKGNADTASKWLNARTITHDGDLVGSYSLDGSKNVTDTSYLPYVTCARNNSNTTYAYHRIMHCSTTNSWVDNSALLFIHCGNQGGGFGIAKVSFRTNSIGSATGSLEISWLARSGLSADCLQGGYYWVANSAYADVYYHTTGTYSGTVIRVLQNARAGMSNGWTLVSSVATGSGASGTNTTNTEVYSGVNCRTYTTTATGTDLGVVNTANVASKTAKTLSVNGKTFNGSADVTVGTIGTAYGGTGNTSYTSGRIIYSSATNKLSSSNITLSGYNITSSASDTTYVKFKVSNSTGGVSLYAATNRGIYDEDVGWLIHTNTSGNAIIPKTLVLTKSTDAAATSDNGPALIIGGERTAQHIEIDGNEIMSKTNGTTGGVLYLNSGCGRVEIGADLTVTGGQISGRVSSGSWIHTTKNGALHLSSQPTSSSAAAVISAKTSSGSWGICTLNGSNNLYFVWGSDTNYNNSANTTAQAYIDNGGGVHGAVWNDYAEYRAGETTEAGRVVKETKNGILKITTSRLEPGCEIISDTFGFAIGETDECKTPIAATGRVLAYPLEDRESYELGQAVCSGPNGTVSKMTREEIMMYPERIIGTVSEIPEYDTWGTGNVSVNGRIWIRIR